MYVGVYSGDCTYESFFAVFMSYQARFFSAENIKKNINNKK